MIVFGEVKTKVIRSFISEKIVTVFGGDLPVKLLSQNGCGGHLAYQ